MRLWLAEYDGVSGMAVEGLRELFALARRGAGGGFDLRSGRLERAGRRERDRFLSAPDSWVVVPTGSQSALDALSDGEIPTELARHHARGCRVAAVCAGNFALAAAGLLHGRPATTHWSLEDEFRRRFPAERLSMERILLDHGDVASAGGYTAFVDLGLFLAGSGGGRALALQVARVLQVDPSRETQLPWLGLRAVPRLSDPGLDELVRRLDADPSRDWDFSALAKEAGMGVRTLQRRFREALGTSPGRWLQERRLERARLRLESGGSVSEACESAGWTDVASFVRLFHQRTGMPPARYREWVRAG